MHELILIENRYVDGQWTFKDSEILELYRSFDRNEDNFYNVYDLKSWNPVPYFKSTRFFVGYYNMMRRGAIWISGWNRLNRTGFINFAWEKGSEVSSITKLRVLLEGTKRVLSMPDFQLLYGETSVSNTETLRLAHYIGFKAVGFIPHAHWNAREGRLEDTVFMYITKEDVRQ